MFGLAGCRPEPLVSELERWHLMPAVQVGYNDTEQAAIEFTEIREMLIGTDENLYVLQHQGGYVLALDSIGRLIRRIGRSGGGPGEFTVPWSIGWDREGLWVAEQGRGRITRFDTTGNLLAVETPGLPPSGPMSTSFPVARFSNGTYINRPGFAAHLISSGSVVESFLLRTDSTGSVLDTLALLPLSNTVLQLRNPANPRSRRLQGPQPIQVGAIYGIDPLSMSIVVVRQDSDVGSSTSFSVAKIDSRGTVAWDRSYRTVGVPLSQVLRDSLIDHYAGIALETEMFANRASARQGVEQALYLPQFLPPIGGLFVARDGTIWLRRAEQSGTVEYTVLDSDGAALATAVVPANVSLMAAKNGTVWGVGRGDLDVPYIVGYRIRR
jgi:hypothetical protein